MHRNSGTLDVPLTKPEAEKVRKIIWLRWFSPEKKIVLMTCHLLLSDSTYYCIWRNQTWYWKVGNYSQEEPRGKVMYLFILPKNFVAVVLGVKIKSPLETEAAIVVLSGWNTLTLSYPSSVHCKQQTCAQLTWGSQA